MGDNRWRRTSAVPSFNHVRNRTNFPGRPNSRNNKSTYGSATATGGSSSISSSVYLSSSTCLVPSGYPWGTRYSVPLPSPTTVPYIHQQSNGSNLSNNFSSLFPHSNESNSTSNSNNNNNNSNSIRLSHIGTGPSTSSSSTSSSSARPDMHHKAATAATQESSKSNGKTRGNSHTTSTLASAANLQASSVPSLTPSSVSSTSLVAPAPQNNTFNTVEAIHFLRKSFSTLNDPSTMNNSKSSTSTTKKAPASTRMPWGQRPNIMCTGQDFWGHLKKVVRELKSS